MKSYNKNCNHCQLSFIAHRKDNVFCCKKCKCAAYKQGHLEEISQYKERYYQNNKEKEDAKTYSWRESNLKEYKAYTQNYYLENKEWIIARVSDYNRQAYKSKPQFRLKNIIRRRLGRLHLKRIGVKSYSSLYGTTIENVVKHIEGLFYEKDSRNMSWNNFGTKWQIDHIVPLCKFDLLDIEQLQKACHYTNLQPLWIEDHCIKTKQDLQKETPYGE